MVLRDGITVIIATYNRAELLSRTLESLCDQTLPVSLFEIIVVDDGSTDSTPNVISVYSDCFDISYLYQEDLGFRVAAARNMGIAAAKRNVLLFLDAGIIVSSNTLEDHLVLHGGCCALAVIGMSYGVLEHDVCQIDIPDERVTGSTDLVISRIQGSDAAQDCRYQYLRSIDFDLDKCRSPWLIFWAGHVSTTTRLARKVGGFDEWFRGWGGEDVDFGLRLQLAGCRFKVLRDICSIHLTHDKDIAGNLDSSRRNISHIAEKFDLPDCTRLLAENWEQILSSPDEHLY